MSAISLLLMFVCVCSNEHNLKHTQVHSQLLLQAQFTAGVAGAIKLCHRFLVH